MRRTPLWLAAAFALSWSGLAQAGAPKDALRFFPPKTIGIFHLNDTKASIDQVLGMVTRFGLGSNVQKGLNQMWRGFHREVMKGNGAAPKSWRGFFQQLGLPPKPQATFALLADKRSKLKANFIGVIPISSSKYALRTFGNLAGNQIKRAVGLCFYLCRSTVTRLRLKGVTGPINMKQFRKESRSFPKRCPHLSRHFKKAGQVDCLSSPKARERFIQKLIQSPKSKKFQGAALYQFPGVSITLAIRGKYALLSLGTKALKQALRRYKTQRKHPLATRFASRHKAHTHMQAYMSYEGVVYLGKLQRKLDKNNPLYRRFPMFAQIEAMTEKMGKGTKDFWLELYHTKGGFHLSALGTTKRRVSKMLAATLRIPPTRYPTLDLVPKNAFFVTSMNYLALYSAMAKDILKKLGKQIFAMRAMLHPWLTMFGQEITLATMSSTKSPLQALVVTQLKSPKKFNAAIARLQKALGRGKPLFKTKKAHGTTIHYLSFKRPRIRGPIPYAGSGEIAFAVSGKRLVLTYQMTRTPNLSLIHKLLNPKQRGPSIRKDPTFKRLMKRSGKSNTFAFLSFTKTLRLIKTYAPPVATVRQILARLGILKYGFIYGKVDQRKRNFSGKGSLVFQPPRP